ncbi:hypothetical protein H5410_030402 [Solanum commersonii]|uniref:Uncharacterized protein n=1 Tax=Solanum commersonii TaxID=4109 RepID=A0A9J5YHB3_SOLCO|nr:hypothetical protein H5410_030402 [Solanum commersonii]
MKIYIDINRTRANRASSSSVPAEVGLIRKVHVVMDSQALTTIPPVIKGAPKLSLSVPATTRITIDVSGVIGAHASYPNSEA